MLIESSIAENNGKDGVKLRDVIYASIHNDLSARNERNGIRITGRSKHILLDHVTVKGAENITKNCGLGIYGDENTIPNDALVSNIQIVGYRTGICVKKAHQLRLINSLIDSEQWNCYHIINGGSLELIANSTCTNHGELPDNLLWCAAGIISGGVCCPSKCGACGGSGCSNKAGVPSDHCCISDIKESKAMCKETSPPCII